MLVLGCRLVEPNDAAAGRRRGSLSKRPDAGFIERIARMANLKFTADVSAPKSAATKAKETPKTWQTLTRDELPENLRDMWDQVEASHAVFKEHTRTLAEGLTESLKRGKSLPPGKVVRISWKRRYNNVSIGLVDATVEQKRKTSGLTFK